MKQVTVKLCSPESKIYMRQASMQVGSSAPVY
jgi:hypothetical protein